MENILDQDITYLKGVGSARAKLLNEELNIITFRDLLYHFPYKYIDRSKIFKITEIDTTLTFIQLKGKITTFRTEGFNKNKRLIADFTDGFGYIELIWFQGINWILKNYTPGKEYLIFGRPNIFKGRISIAHPEIETLEKNEENKSSFYPQYRTTEKLKTHYVNSKTLQKLISNLFDSLHTEILETLPGYLIKKLNLIKLHEAFYSIHFPINNTLLEKANYRLKFEELFFIQLNILKLRIKHQTDIKGYVFSKVGEMLNTFYRNKLKFELTNSQKYVIKEIRKDMGSGKQMNRLLQGDVGSGKTLVALMCILIALDNYFQSCIMVPTEILANQHFNTIRNLLNGMNIKVSLLTGNTKKSERNEILHDLEKGTVNILIGTHALLEDPVKFSKLGLVIIDEQHRFGVAQRAKLWNKTTDNPPHILIMTATPIPRTLAMTLYGDLDVSIISELPPGRKPIKTFHYFETKRLAMFGFLKKQMNEGKQIYIVYPLIKESEKLDYKDLEDGYEAISRAFPLPNYFISCIHGKMTSKDKELAMNHFISGKAQLLIATTVIEVGVDIPNACVMVIESAERFGLSQLHQLRGRVGRGAKQSFCILMTSNKLSLEARKRMETMVMSTDGFEIAEVDLKLRGPGDMEGTQQSGIPFNLRLANLSKDGQLIQYTRNIAGEILDDDPLLTKVNNKILNDQLVQLKNKQTDWSKIS